MSKSVGGRAPISTLARITTVVLVSAPFMTTLRPAKAADPATEVLTQAKVAMGGTAWDHISGWHERGRHGDAAYDTLLDFHHWGSRFANNRGGITRVRGFNGTTVWDQDASGKVSASHDSARLADARQSAYGSIFGFFFPERFRANFKYLGTKTEDGVSFDVINIIPESTVPMEVWIDRSTHYVARFVDRSGPKPVTAFLSDYRPLGGVLEPSKIEVSDGDPGHASVGRVDDVTLEAVKRSAFDPPT